jgi:hypothetical protein
MAGRSVPASDGGSGKVTRHYILLNTSSNAVTVASTSALVWALLKKPASNWLGAK